MVYFKSTMYLSLKGLCAAPMVRNSPQRHVAEESGGKKGRSVKQFKPVAQAKASVLIEVARLAAERSVEVDQRLVEKMEVRCRAEHGGCLRCEKPADSPKSALSSLSYHLRNVHKEEDLAGEFETLRKHRFVQLSIEKWPSELEEEEVGRKSRRKEPSARQAAYNKVMEVHGAALKKPGQPWAGARGRKKVKHEAE